MRKTHEVLRLHFELKLKQRQIARSANLSQSTVHESLHRFTAAGLIWPLPEQMSEPELEAALFLTDPKPARGPARNLPDFSHIHKELQEHKHVTLQLLWEEYGATHPDGYRYSQFCHHYQQWKRQRDIVMRQEHRPNEKLFVDWAGDKISVHEPPRCSGGARSEQLHLCRSHRRRDHVRLDRCARPGLRVMGGVAELLIPDNTKTGVSKACRYEPDLNPSRFQLLLDDSDHFLHNRFASVAPLRLPDRNQPER